MRQWLNAPSLLRRDMNAEFAACLEIDMDEIIEPLLACPNNPDDVRQLNEVSGDEVQEVFIGSCMTHIEHYRLAAKILRNAKSLPVRLWITPPTRLELAILEREGVMDLFRKIGARCEIPGCSLCMGNQAQVADGTTVISTSTRNFDNRLGNNAKVYLGSAELAAMAALLGRLPSKEEYFEIFNMS